MVRRHRGFTLVELLVTTGMLSMLAAAGFAALSTGIKSAAKARRYGAMIAHGQVALQTLTRDIRAAVKSNDFCLVSLDNEHEGLDADTLDFVALRKSRIDVDEFDEPTGSRCEIGYYIENDDDTEIQWMLRREDGTLDDDPLEGGIVTLAGPFVSELEFEFYDGLFWQSGWEDAKTFPEAIRIYIAVVDEDETENPIYFTTTVQIISR